MFNLIEKIRSFRGNKPEDETTSQLRFIDEPPFVHYTRGQFDVKAKGMWTGLVGFEKLILEKRKLEEVYEDFLRRSEKQFVYPLGVCNGPSGDGPGIYFDLYVKRTANPEEIYFKLHEIGGFCHSLIGKISKLPREKIENISYGYAALLTSGKLPGV